MTGHIDVKRIGAIAYVSVCHAGKFNAISRAMWLALKNVFQQIQCDAGIRCVVVEGAEGHFCAGGDISEYPGFRFDAAELQHFHEQEVWGALEAMLDCDVPIIAHIQGNCMGAGVEIASCCDIRIASDNAKFGAPIARLGFPMAPREAALVSQATGQTVARAMLLAAEIFDAAEMLRCGFLTRVLPAGTLAAHIDQLVERVQALAPQAARQKKQTLRALSRAEQSDSADCYAYASSGEHREGISAFLQKRKPRF
jgi:enoyl-CoA hydratase/carnithine racemase